MQFYFKLVHLLEIEVQKYSIIISHKCALNLPTSLNFGDEKGITYAVSRQAKTT